MKSCWIGASQVTAASGPSWEHHWEWKLTCKAARCCVFRCWIEISLQTSTVAVVHQHLVWGRKRRTKNAANCEVFPSFPVSAALAPLPSQAHLGYKLNSPPIMKLEQRFHLCGFYSKAKPSTHTKLNGGQWSALFFWVWQSKMPLISKQVFSTVLGSPNLFKTCHTNYFPRFLLNVNFWVWQKNNQSTILTFWVLPISTYSPDVWKQALF